MSASKGSRSWLRAHWKLALVVLAVLLVLGALGVAYAVGLFGVERHRGFLAAAWDRDAGHVYLIERETRGFVWGFGWEFFTPPANSRVMTDRFSLVKLDSETGSTRVLERFDGGPLVGRTTKHYRGRIFGIPSARIVPTAEGVEFVVAMNVPRVPRSESWALAGTWSPARPSGATWSQAWAGSTATPDEVLLDGVEVMTVRGVESYPAAVLAVDADGAYRVLAKTRAFDRLYPNGVPEKQIAERAQRPRIEREREFQRVQDELTAKHRARGLSDGAARLRAYDEMEELGYLPKSPRLVATPLTEPPADARVFDIPEEYFRVGLFQDIAAAIASPGEEVKTSTGTYLKYYDDELGPRLKAWLNDGNDRFAVRTEGSLWLLEVRRFDKR